MDAAARYDSVGLASWYGEELAGNRTASGDVFEPAAITAAHRTLPLGSVAEVTSLDTGRTILVLVNDRGPNRDDREIDLSRGAAALLGTSGNPIAPVRVRAIVAAQSDVVALRAGRPAASRLDAPPPLLAALRKQLPPDARIPAPLLRRTRVQSSAPVVSRSGHYVVQVAAFSSVARARALAKALGGSTQSAGQVTRVRLGPFATAAEAQRARDAVARRGYGDATVLNDH